MQTVSKDTYLGDILSNDGSNTANIKARVSKGMGILAKIKSILECVSFGSHYFKIALLLRESMLLNGILTNSESWYGLSKSEVTQLEKVDLEFFRALFSVPGTVPTAGIYLETGCYRIGTIIKVRRLNFLHAMMRLDKSEMLSKFFHAQWEKPVKFDWVLDVQENLVEFDLPTRLVDIQTMSKYKFKNLVKERAKQYELKQLLEISKEKSKMKNLTYTELKIQDYLLLKTMNTSEAKSLFKFRLRMAPFGENFRGGQKSVLCPLCKVHPDGQRDSFECTEMKKVINIKGDYMKIFGPNIPEELVKTIHNICNFREELRKMI